MERANNSTLLKNVVDLYLEKDAKKKQINKENLLKQLAQNKIDANNEDGDGEGCERLLVAMDDPNLSSEERANHERQLGLFYKNTGCFRNHFIEDSIKNNKFVFFTQSECVDCQNAITLWNDKFSNPNMEKPLIIDLQKRKDEEKIKHALKAKTSQRTVPYVFINELFVGGYDALQRAANGNGGALLKNAVDLNLEKDEKMKQINKNKLMKEL